MFYKGGLLYFGGVRQEPFSAVCGLDVHGGVRQELYLSYFLAVCVKRSFSVAVSAEFFGVMAVSENPIRNLVKHDNLFVYTCYIRNLVK